MSFQNSMHRIGCFCFLGLLLSVLSTATQANAEYAPIIEKNCDLVGDLNGDCDVNGVDFGILAAAWLTEPGMAHWDSAGDVSFPYDLTVDVEDLAALTNNWLIGQISSVPFTPVTLSAGGGTYSFDEGAEIEIPAGAFPEDEEIMLRLIPEEEIAPYLSQGLTDKHFLAALEVQSDTRQFDMPISITLPTDSDDEAPMLPYLYYLNRKTGVLLPDVATLESSRPGTSKSKTSKESTNLGKYFTMDCDKKELKLRDLSEFPPEDWVMVMVKMDKILTHSDCIQNPCKCCTFKVQEEAADYAESNRCANVAVDGHIQFLDCPGQPTESWGFEEQSISLELTLRPNRPIIQCQESLTLFVDVYDINGIEIEDYEVTASSSSPELLTVAEMGANMFLLERTGELTGEATVRVDGGCNIKESLNIKVGCPMPDLTGKWNLSTQQRVWGCAAPENDGIYSLFNQEIFLNHLTENIVGGSILLTDEDESFYEELVWTIESKCSGHNECTYTLKGRTNYLQQYYDPDSGEVYTVRGFSNCEGVLTGNDIVTVDFFGIDTEGDQCAHKGRETLERK